MITSQKSQKLNFSSLLTLDQCAAQSQNLSNTYSSITFKVFLFKAANSYSFELSAIGAAKNTMNFRAFGSLRQGADLSTLVEITEAEAAFYPYSVIAYFSAFLFLASIVSAFLSTNFYFLIIPLLSVAFFFFSVLAKSQDKTELLQIIRAALNG